MEGLLLFTLLWLISRTAHPPGAVFWSFLAGYGLCRFVVEYFREPDMQIGILFGSFSMGQLLSYPMIFIGFFMLFLSYHRRAGASACVTIVVHIQSPQDRLQSIPRGR